ncbi:MAG: squalene/phytoene synthase family protein, partial [Paracoccaceae bacterium]
MSMDACAAIVARGDPDRFLAAMSAPLWARERLLPLYAFNVEVARAPWVTSEPRLAEMRLAWWRGEVVKIGSGAGRFDHEVL